MAEQSFYAVASAADFEPEGMEPGLIEVSLAALPGVPFGAGLYRIEFVRILDPGERLNMKGVLSSPSLTDEAR